MLFLLVTLLSPIIILLLFFIYCLYFTRHIKKNIGRFACSIEAESFAFSHNVKLTILSNSFSINFGLEEADSKVLLFDEFRKIFSSKGDRSFAKCEYKDYFYESLEIIMRKEKSEIIRDVKWYLSKNFFRLPSFYRVLFNCFPFKPYLPYIVRNVLTNPDYVMEHVPDNLKIYARLTLMEIDSLQKPRISELHRQAKESTLAEKCSARQLNVYKTILQNPTRKLSKSEAKTLGEKIVHSIQQSRNPGQLIASYIEKITFDFQHLGSNRDGNCKLHALSMKLTDLFAAEFINTHSDKRIIFHFDAGRLTFYTILNSHQYPLLKFTKKIGNLYEEKLFLNYFNQVKYRYTRIEDRIKSLAEILQNLQNKFSLNTQQYFTNNISKIHSLLS